MNKPHIFTLTFKDKIVKLFRLRLNQKRDNPLIYSYKSPFINFYSNAIINNDGGKASKRWMFVNGKILDKDLRGSLYQYNKEYRPLPIILDVKINTFGDYGALRKVSITLVCFSLLQLLLLLKIYMIPGITCVLQYGWTNRTNLFIDYNKHFDLNIDTIMNFRLSNDYNSDLILGIISNFSHSLNSLDGSFTINLLLISMGNKFFLLFKQKEDNVLLLTNGLLRNKFNIENLEDIIKNNIPIKTINNKKYIMFYFILLFFRNNKISINSSFNLYRNNPYLRSINPDLVFFLVSNDLVNIPNNNQDNYIVSILISVLLFLLSLKLKDYFSILEYILNKINYNTIHWLDLKIKHIGGEIQVIDMNNMSILLDKNIFLFKLYNSIILSISLLTSLPNLLKSVAVYTRNTLNESSLMATYIKRIWGSLITDRNRDVLKNKTESNINNLTHSLINALLGNAITNPNFNLGFDKFSSRKDINQDKIKRLLNDKQQKYKLNIDLILYLKKTMYRNIPERNGRLLPISISITIDGISGILYGNLFKIDYLNNTYLKLSLFVVTEVSDSINSKWSTTLTGILMSNPKGSK